jgi:hypothetical protein
MEHWLVQEAAVHPIGCGYAVLRPIRYRHLKRRLGPLMPPVIAIAAASDPIVAVPRLVRKGQLLP